MHTNHYYIEMMQKERHKQFLAEAKRLRLAKTVTSTRTKNRKSVSGFITRIFKNIRAILQREHEPMTYKCSQG